MTEEIGSQHPVVGVQGVDQVRPVVVRAEQPVDEQHDWAGAAVDVRQQVTVQAGDLHRSDGQQRFGDQRHEWSLGSHTEE